MTELSVLTEIIETFGKITEGDIARAQRRLGPIRATEKPLGALHSETLKKVWTTAEYYESVVAQSRMDATYKAESEDAALDLFQQAARAVTLEEIARNLFWAQAKDDIGSIAWRADGGVGLRAGWMLVETGPEPSPLRALLGRIGLQPPEES